MAKNIISFDDEEFSSKIVYCIQKGVIDEPNDHKKEHMLTTRNYLRSIHLDYAHTELEKVFNDGYTFTEKYKVGFWEGLFVYSNEKACTITIMSKNRFNQIKKRGTPPKYLKAFLCAENKGLESQESLFDIPYPKEEYEEAINDFFELTRNISLDVEKIHHYIMVFSKRHDRLASVEAVLVTPELELVKSWDLSKFITADMETIVFTANLEENTIKDDTSKLITVKVKGAKQEKIIESDIKAN